VIGCLYKLLAETTMTTKLGRSLSISLRSISRASLRRASIYTWRNEPAVA
jgi:hypothetical protein